MRIPELKGSIAFTLIFFFVFTTAVAQENYQPGYLVQFDGDTVWGYIDYRNWEQNPRNITFVDQLSGSEKKVYTPLDIASFSVHKEIYVSAKVEKETSFTRVDELDENPELNLVQDTVFLRAYVMGEKSLYYLKFEMGRENFFIRQDNEWLLLKYKRYIRKKDGIGYATERKTFIGQLTAYLQDCPTIGNKLTNLKYKPTSLMSAYKSYYKCVDSDPVYEFKKEKVKAEFSLLAGFSITTLTIKYSGNVEKFDPSYSFSGGMALDVIFPYNQGKFSINNELVYTGYGVDGHHEDIRNEDYYTIVDFSNTYRYVKLNNMFRFKYPFGNWFVFVNAGISNGFLVSSSSYQKVVKKFYGPESVTESNGPAGGRSYEQGYLGGIGARYKKFTFEARYERGNGTAVTINENTITNRYYFLFGYRF